MILNKFRDTINRYGLISRKDKILVAVSGGPDSVTLLYLLNSLKKELGLILHVAHLDHMLRRGSSLDRLFVERLAGRLGLAVTSAEINVKKIACCGSLEEVARNARLNFLFKAAKRIKADKIALGHNLDDQAETVLMRLLRGSGLYGLAGILPKRDICGFCVIRPLIEIKRSEIEAFLKKKKINPRRDTSNSQDIYFRNKIRHNLLPLLEREYSGNIRKILSNTAESIACDYDYLSRAAGLAQKRLGKRVNLEKFSKLHRAIQRLVLRLNISGLKGSMRRIEFRHILEIEDLISSRPVNSIVDLPGGISAVKKAKFLSFYRR